MQNTLFFGIYCLNSFFVRINPINDTEMILEKNIRADALACLKAL